MQEKVSVVITTKNEEKNIENCLKSIQLQTWTNIEIIVVDNNSKDDSIEIARELGATVIALSSNVGFSKANNIAFNSCLCMEG